MAEPTWLSYSDAAAFEALSDVVNAADDAAWHIAVEAAAEYVEDRRDELDYTAPANVPAMVRLGTSRLAHRWFDRKNNPLGSATFSEFAGEMLRHDPDISMMLGLGPNRPFTFGAGLPLPVEEPAP